MFCVATRTNCKDSRNCTPESTWFHRLERQLDLEVKRVLQSSDLALVITEWSFKGTGPDGKSVNMAAKSADVLRKQSDGTWRFVIDNP